jgi:TrmH family RNA methyltransferase
MAAAGGVEILDQIVSPDLGGVSVVSGVNTTALAPGPFTKASIRQNPDGVMAVAALLDTRLDRLEPPPGCLLLVVEAVEKPGNLGAMLRTADALGVDAVLVADPTTDIHNPNVVRASQGALFTVPIGVAPTNEVVTWLGRTGITLVATTPSAAKSLWDADLSGSVAVAVGTESTGLSTVILGAATDEITIPTAGNVDSLNASVTAAIVLCEAARQRRHP